MKEVTVVGWCDGCISEIGERTDSPERAVEELSISINDGKALVVDLCEVHRKALVEPLELLLASYGAQLNGSPPRAKAKRQKRPGGSHFPTADGPWQCLCDAEPFPTGSDFIRHLRGVHGTRNLTDAFGKRCPLDGHTVNTLGPHNTRAHRELPNQSALFVEAEKQGDPHKVVAKQRRALLRVRR